MKIIDCKTWEMFNTALQAEATVTDNISIRDRPEKLQIGFCFDRGSETESWVTLGLNGLRGAPDIFKSAMRSDAGKESLVGALKLRKKG